MKLLLNSEVIQSIPGVTVAAVVMKNVKNLRKTSTIASLLRGVCAEKKRELKDEDKKKMIQNLLKTGTQEGKTLSEVQLIKNLLNKIGTGKDVDSMNNLADLLHFLSIKYLIPTFARDLDQVEKDLEVAFIVPKKGKKVEDYDIVPETNHIVFWLVDIGSHLKEDFLRMPDMFAASVQKYCGGEKEAVYWLNADLKEIDLQYTSEKEKEYKETEAQKAQEQEIIEQIKTTDTVPFIEETVPEPEGVPAEAEVSVKEIISEQLLKALKSYLAAENLQVPEYEQKVQLENPHDLTHGDIACNIAMKLSKILGRSPRELAEGILKHLEPLSQVEGTEIAGPGFINFKLSKSYLEHELENIIKQKQHFGRSNVGAGHKIMIEYSSPNIAKPLGVHHLLSTIIGQTLVDIYRYLGYEVMAVNYPGDWGTQFGKLLYAYKNWGNMEVVQKDPLNELLKLYVQFHNEAEKDPTLDDRGREEFKKLEEGDEENHRLWQWMKDLSIKEIERLYQKLGVKFDLYLGEQMYLEAAKDVIKEGLDKAIITLGERDALIVKYENDKYPPSIVQKSDGTTMYSTRDLASIKDRIEKYHPEKIVYVVDVAQTLHFNQLFETASLLGYTGTDLVHVVFGRMQMPEGRMSTRKGEVILLDEVISEAEQKTKELTAEKSSELSENERKDVAEKMAISAIKYNIISQNRETNITFEWDKILSLEGNSGPYLEYAYARARSILRKYRESLRAQPKPLLSKDGQTSLFSAAEESKPTEPDTEPFMHPSEQRLMRMLYKFPEVIERAAADFKPNHLCTYLYDLSRAFSSFYNEAPVLSASRDDVKQARLKLVEGFSHVLGNGLKVLGIATFERM
ncbi:arginine--tRNA ligase [Candidatus Peregrinibacteria bacterium]|nr:arginine--tRNA ligase [Candidatus Peregrinibacteria bacterium]